MGLKAWKERRSRNKTTSRHETNLVPVLTDREHAAAELLKMLERGPSFYEHFDKTADQLCHRVWVSCFIRPLLLVLVPEIGNEDKTRKSPIPKLP